MTNHPRRAPIYRVQMADGRYGRAAGYRATLNLARTMAGAPDDASEAALAKDYGVTIARVRGKVARFFGL